MLVFWDETQFIGIYLLLFIIFTRINWNPIFRKVGLFCFYFASFTLIIVQDIPTFTTYIEGIAIPLLLLALGYFAYRSKNMEANKESNVIKLTL